MTLRDIFKFRELPESETTKPFLEHLEDLRWTIVKIAITLVVAMIVCFVFRTTLVRIMQAPLSEVGSQIGTLKALGITDSLVISFHLAFYAGWPVVETTAQLILSASLLHDRHGFAFWDAMVVEAALLSGATTLLTEDMQDGRRLGGLTIRNPFRSDD